MPSSYCNRLHDENRVYCGCVPERTSSSSSYYNCSSSEIPFYNSSSPINGTFGGFDSTTENQVIVELIDSDLWKKFSYNNTEMIITRSGRRMFPLIKIKIDGLEKSENYIIFLDMVPSDNYRYKYTDSKWVVSGKADPIPPKHEYLHQNSPASGEFWMNKIISFQKVKLTNNFSDENGHIILNSMHKYIPRINILRLPNKALNISGERKTFLFKETEFIAVTAYQNDAITQLKIDFNPFAKGFREREENRKRTRGRLRCNRESFMSEEEVDIESTNMPGKDNITGKNSSIESLNDVYKLNMKSMTAEGHPYELDNKHFYYNVSTLCPHAKHPTWYNIPYKKFKTDLEMGACCGEMLKRQHQEKNLISKVKKIRPKADLRNIDTLIEKHEDPPNYQELVSQFNDFYSYRNWLNFVR